MEPPKQTALARILRQQDTWAERLLWRWLRDRRFSGYKFRRQHPFGPYFLDFFCVETLVDIELDGRQHGHPGHQGADARRDAWLEARGVRVLRFWNSRLRQEKETIRDTIWRTLQEQAPRPMPGYCRPMAQAAPGSTTGATGFGGPFPLTPALSPGERESISPFPRTVTAPGPIPPAEAE
jgi:very-short-patch-repair endonuclease